MLIKLFKGSGPGVIFFVAVTFTAVWVKAFIHPSSFFANIQDSGQMPLFEFLVKLTGHSAGLQTVIAFTLVAIIAFLLVNFNTANFFITERTYLPALIYILVGGLFPEYQSLNPVVPASLFIILAVIRITDGYRKPGIGNNFFDAGLLISTGSLFYANLIWFGALLLIGIALVRTISMSDILISLAGLVTPYLLAFGIYYVAGKDPGALLSIVEGNLLMGPGGYFFPRFTIVALLIISIIIIVSIVFLFTMLNSKKIKARKTFSLLLWLFLISVAVYIIMPSVSVEMVWITAIPSSYFLTHYVIFRKKKMVSEIFLSLLFILVFTIQIIHL